MKQQNKHTNKVSKPHKYRVSVYLGKDLYAMVKGMAELMHIPVATATRILLETGTQIAMAQDKASVESLMNYGKSKI